jgi:2-oxoacid:acceptor oxidoreductase gamma subunit (pyruvate/2-ketoisovalerate family)
MKEIRIHGRGGQGAATTSRILTTAFVREGKWACGFPVFGFERRGAPLAVFVRVDDKVIREKTKVYCPDCVVVIDPSLLHTADIFQGIKNGSIAVANAPASVEEKMNVNLKRIGSVDATAIAVEEIGASITNTCMLGAFARTTGWIGLDAVLAALGEYFNGDKLKKNDRAVRRGYEETRVVTF